MRGTRRIQSEAAAYVVDDQQRLLIGNTLLDRRQELLQRQFDVVHRVVLDGADHHGSDVTLVAVEAGVDALNVVPDKLVELAAVGRWYAEAAGHRPRVEAVVRPGGHKQLHATGVASRDPGCQGGHIGAVLAEHRPVGEREARHEGLRQFEQTVRREAE